MTTEPTKSLRAIETSLRRIVRKVLGEDWLTKPGAPEQGKLEERRTEEEKRRHGAIISTDLIDYTETYHLEAIITKNWDEFKPVFDDQKRTYAFFAVLADVRNSIAHSRDLVPFEQELLSGISGYFRNIISTYRGSANPVHRFYPRIESVTDSFGRLGKPDQYGPHDGYEPARLEMGDVLTFTCRSRSARNRQNKWKIMVTAGGHFLTMQNGPVGTGDDLVFDFIIPPKVATERLTVAIYLESDSAYHLSSDGSGAFDDVVHFHYAVNPPENE